MHTSARMLVGAFMIMAGSVPAANSGGKDSLGSIEDFRPGDTLRFTTDGSLPDRSSAFVLFGANEVMVTKTTIFNARLYRPGFLPSEVQSDTVFVRDSVGTLRAAVRPREGGVAD